MGNDRGVEPLDDTAPLPQALGPVAVLDARVEHDLHAHADAEDRAVPGEPAVDDLVAADGAQAGHARGEGSHTGYDQAGGLARGAPVRRELDVGADPLEGPDRGPDVAESVVEHHHPRPAGGAPRRAARVQLRRHAAVGQQRRRRGVGPGHRILRKLGGHLLLRALRAAPESIRIALKRPMLDDATTSGRSVTSSWPVSTSSSASGAPPSTRPGGSSPSASPSW